MLGKNTREKLENYPATIHDCGASRSGGYRKILTRKGEIRQTKRSNSQPSNPQMFFFYFQKFDQTILIAQTDK